VIQQQIILTDYFAAIRISDNVEISESERYAELWMGTHPSGPSSIRGAATTLREHLRDRPQLVGVVPPSYPTDDLPFLFKVLSVGTALSIQAHPNKSLARELHENFPLVYKDPNHKPEMAVALTTFEALCGFRALREIHEHLQAYPELREVVGTDPVAAVAEVVHTGQHAGAEANAALQAVFTAYVECDTTVMSRCVAALVARLSERQTEGCPPQPPASPNGGLSLDGLILRLSSQYPGDCGIFSPLLLNYLTLAPGQSFFMGANVPHAYLAGDCVECMALSDNVVRVGLTPKHRDVPTLLGMLHYAPTELADLLLQPVAVDTHTQRYRPPADICEEFEVERSIFSSAVGEVCLRALPCASIILVYKGCFDMQTGGNSEVIAAGCGDVFFLPANASMSCLTTEGDANANVDTEVTLFRAHLNCA